MWTSVAMPASFEIVPSRIKTQIDESITAASRSNFDIRREAICLHQSYILFSSPLRPRTIKPMQPKGRRASPLKTPRRSTIYAAAAAASLALFSATESQAANVGSTWKTNVLGNWGQYSNWINNPNVIDYPHNGATNTYDVQINSGDPLLDVSPTVRSLTLSGGSIVSSQSSTQPGTNVITVTDFINFSGGTAYVPMRVTGDLRISGALAKGLVSGAVTVGGSVTFPTTGAFQLSAGTKNTVIDVQSTGSFLVTQPLTIADPVDQFYIAFGRIFNAGLFDQAATAPITLGNQWYISNSGTMILRSTFKADDDLVSSGVLDLQSANAALALTEGGYFSGAVKLAPGSSIALNGGTMSLSDITFTNSGTINIASWLTITTPTTIPGVLNFTTNTAQINLDANAAFTGPATFTDGLIKGTNRLSVSNLNFMAGTISGAELFVLAGGVLNLTTTAVRQLNSATLTIAGTANWSAGSFVSSSSSPSNHAQVMPTGMLNILPSASASLTRFNPSNGPVDFFDNSGLVNIDHASFTIGEGWRVNNMPTGAIRAIDGTITFFRPQLDNSGLIDLQSGANLTYTGGENATFSNAQSGSVSIDASSSAFINARGTLSNAGLITLNGGTFTASDNSFVKNSGTFRASAGHLTLGYASMTNSGVIDLSGPVFADFSSSVAAGAISFRNAATGVILLGPSASANLTDSFVGTFSNDGLLSVDRALSTSLNFQSIINNGTIRAASAPLNVTFKSVTNSGVIDLQSGSSAKFQGNTFNLTGPGTLMANGASASISLSSGAFSNAGLVTLDKSTLSINCINFINTGIIRIATGAASFSAMNYNNTGKIELSAGGAAIFSGGVGNPLTNIRSQAAAGNLLISSETDPTDAVGYASADQIKATGSWHGLPITQSSVLVLRTFAGDANLDGTVNFVDLVAVAQHYGTNNGSAYWFYGDFDYDGNVNFADLVAVAQHYGDEMPSSPIPGASADFKSDLAAAFASVPEPGTSMCLLASVLALSRRQLYRRDSHLAR